MGWESVLGAHELLAVLESQAAKVAFDVLDRMESTSIYLCKSMRESMSQERSSSTELSLELCGWVPQKGRKGAGWTGLWVCSPHFNQTTPPSSRSQSRLAWKALVGIRGFTFKVLTSTVYQEIQGVSWRCPG